MDSRKHKWKDMKIVLGFQKKGQWNKSKCLHPDPFLLRTSSATGGYTCPCLGLGTLLGKMWRLAWSSSLQTVSWGSPWRCKWSKWMGIGPHIQLHFVWHTTRPCKVLFTTSENPRQRPSLMSNSNSLWLVHMTRTISVKISIYSTIRQFL